MLSFHGGLEKIFLLKYFFSLIKIKKLHGMANCCKISFREAIKEFFFGSPLNTKMAVRECVFLLLCFFSFDICLAENRLNQIHYLVNARLLKIVNSILMGLESLEKNSNNLNVDSLLGIKIVRGEAFVLFGSNVKYSYLSSIKSICR